MVKEQFILKILSPLLSASCNFTFLHMLAHQLSGGPTVLADSLTATNTLPDSLISLLLSQALCRLSKTQLRGLYLPPLLSIHMLSMLGPFDSPPVCLQCLLCKLCCSSFISVNISDPIPPHLPYSCYSFPKTSHVHQPTCPSLSTTQTSSLSSFQIWLSNFSLTTSHLLPPQNLIFLDSGSAYT